MLNGNITTQNGIVRAPWLEARGAVQAGRVAHGVRTGTIDQNELSDLKTQRHDTRAQLNEYKADGRVNLQERAALHQDLNDISHSIRDYKKSPAQGTLGAKESYQASIIGDPHFAMSGSVNGQEVDTKFDNHDLGNRTQIAGAGFQLETNTVEWGSGNGAAVVGSATVTTGFGKAQKEVGLDADGNLSVNGRNVDLESGETVNLNRTSTLSHNEDGTYTVSSRNGKVTNTMSVNQHDLGNYLNIYTSVDDVQTVGWFQNQA